MVVYEAVSMLQSGRDVGLSMLTPSVGFGRHSFLQTAEEFSSCMQHSLRDIGHDSVLQC